MVRIRPPLPSFQWLIGHPVPSPGRESAPSQHAAENQPHPTVPAASPAATPLRGAACPPLCLGTKPGPDHPTISRALGARPFMPARARCRAPSPPPAPPRPLPTALYVRQSGPRLRPRLSTIRSRIPAHGARTNCTGRFRGSIGSQALASGYGRLAHANRASRREATPTGRFVRAPRSVTSYLSIRQARGVSHVSHRNYAGVMRLSAAGFVTVGDYPQGFDNHTSYSAALITIRTNLDLF